MAEEKKKFDFTSLNTLAVVSLAAALTSFAAIAAIITGHFSLAQIKKTGESGRGLAIAGLVIGYGTVAFWIIGGVGMLIAKFFWLGGYYDGGYGNMGPGMMGWRD
jgi:peptidyl-prolyl cis-trans isomerase B (cyclophilin B)